MYENFSVIAQMRPDLLNTSRVLYSLPDRDFSTKAALTLTLSTLSGVLPDSLL